MTVRILGYGLVIAACVVANLPGAAAQDSDAVEIPGLATESGRFVDALSKPYPAGGTDATRRQSEARANAALMRNDWSGVASALEDRLGQGSPSFDLWRQLAQAELKRNPPDPRRAADAAWQAAQNADDDKNRAAAYALVAQALLAQNRPAPAGSALRTALANDPGNITYKQMLDDANRTAGLVVQRTTAHEDADPPRACIAFNIPPTRRGDFHPEDWITLTPPVADAAITREGDGICVSGLPLAATTTATLRVGLPADGGLALKATTPVRLVMGNRPPMLAFDSRLFLLPRGQTPHISLTSSNISSVSVRIARLTERTMLPWARSNELGKPFGPYLTSSIDKGSARIVWSGKADIPAFRTNALLHTVLPLPTDAMAAPGLYAVSVEPADGHNSYDAGAVQPVLQTDLAPTVWRGTDGLTVQMRSYSDARPRADVSVRLMAQNNDVLAQAITDADGIVRFAAPLLHGEGVMAAAAVQGLLDPPAGSDAQPDFVSLNLDTAAFDLSDRGVSGTKQPGVLDAWMWSDRGIFRPGETVHLMALLRDNGGQPIGRPAHVKVLRPNGSTFLDTVVQPGGGGSLHLPVTLSSGASAGIWTAQVLPDPAAPPVATMQFKVDAFIPDRMRVTVGPLPPQLAAGGTTPVPVTARFLYGAAAAHLTGSASIHLGFAPEPPAVLTGFQVGLVDEAFTPEATQVELPPTDDEGRTTLPLRIATAPDTTHPVQAVIDVEVDDPSGHATHIPATVAIRPSGPLIGIKPLFTGGSVDAGGEAAFDMVAADADGHRIGLPVTLRLVREKPEWRLVNNGSLSSYQTVWRDDPLETHEMTIPSSGMLHFARKLDFGRYRIEVAQKNGLAATSVRFRSGWVSSDSPDVPDRADVSADKRAYVAGTTARVHVSAPFGGPAELLVLSDHVHARRTVEVPPGGGDFDVPVDAAWGPGAYVAVHVFRAGGDGKRPDRAIGLTWLGIDPAARHLDLSWQAPDLVRPRAPATVKLRTAPGAWVSIAAVDQGILQLTSFTTPDPSPHFLGRRALGVDIRDDYGRLIAAADGTATALRQGGDEGAGRRPNIPQQIVSFFTPPVQADAAGEVSVTLPFPDFNGQVRLMAVAWDGNRLGSASTEMLVRDQLVAEPLLPRFLSPGDTSRLAVLLQNLDLSAGSVSVRVTTDGPLVIDGDPVLNVTLAHGAQAMPGLILRATTAGVGHVQLDVTGPDGFHAQHAAVLDVHSVRAPDSVVAAGAILPDATASLNLPSAGFVPGTWQARAVFGSPVRYDAAAMMQTLHDYPLFCLEQAASKGMPLTAVSDNAVPDRLGQLQQAVNNVLDRQRYDGGFGLWSANDDAEPWLSVYATEFLLRAQRAGATVGPAGLKDALSFLAEALSSSPSKPEDYARRAYRLYVLALGGQARAGSNRVLFEALDKLPTPLSRAQLAAALTLSNDNPRAEAAFKAALADPGRSRWMADYGSAVRDQAAVAVLLKESGLLGTQLGTLISQLPGADTRPKTLDTQELAWLATAAGILGRREGVTRISLDGRPLPPAPVVTVALTGPVTARNSGDRAVWRTVSVTGVPAQSLPASRAQMRVTRKFFRPDGSVLDLQRLRQNDVFVLLLEGAAEDRQGHRVQVLQGLPAGWEIVGRLAGGQPAGMPWLGTLSDTEAQPAADDRFQAVVDLKEEKPEFRVAVRLRAVTPGNYDIPGADVSDMYRPSVYARQGDNRIDVLPAN